MKKSIYFGIFTSVIFYLLYPYTVDCVLYLSSSVSFGKPDVFSAYAYIIIAMIGYVIATYIFLKQTKSILYRKIIGNVIGFFTGTICSIVLLLIMSHIKMIYYHYKLNILNNIGIMVTSDKSYIYANAYIPFCIKNRFLFDMKIFIATLLYSILDIVVVHTVIRFYNRLIHRDSER